MIDSVYINCDRCIATMIMMIIMIMTFKNISIMILRGISIIILMRILKTIDEKLTIAIFLNNVFVRTNLKIWWHLNIDLSKKIWKFDNYKGNSGKSRWGFDVDITKFWYVKIDIKVLRIISIDYSRFRNVKINKNAFLKLKTLNNNIKMISLKQ